MTKQKKQVGAWTQLSSREVYNNPWIRVTHDEVLTPANTEGIYGRIHFKNRAIGIIPVDNEGNTWLVKQSRYALNAYTWEIPEGGAGHDEDSLAAAKRELEEECGLCARSWRHLRSMHLSNSVTDEVAEVYVAENLYPGVQALEPTEDIELKKLPLKEALGLVLSNEITDAISVAGLMHLALEMNL